MKKDGLCHCNVTRSDGGLSHGCDMKGPKGKKKMGHGAEFEAGKPGDLETDDDESPEHEATESKKEREEEDED